MSELLRLDDLNPDGVRITVDWSQFVPGSSVFVPCLNVDKAERQLMKLADRKKLDIKVRLRTEMDKIGLRIWRVA